MRLVAFDDRRLRRVFFNGRDELVFASADPVAHNSTAVCGPGGIAHLMLRSILVRDLQKIVLRSQGLQQDFYYWYGGQRVRLPYVFEGLWLAFTGCCLLKAKWPVI